MDFDISTFNKSKKYVVEASAGTGKTYNIIEIVKKLIDEGVKLKDILIVTFTEKATGELKNRIRAEIKNENIEDANIYTIHSFCQNTIKEYGLAAGLPLGLDLADESLIDDFFDIYIREGDILKDLTLLYENDPDFKLSSFKDKIKAAVNKYYLDNYYKEVRDISTFNFLNVMPIEEYAKMKGAVIFENLCMDFTYQGFNEKIGEIELCNEDVKFYNSIKSTYDDKRVIGFNKKISKCNLEHREYILSLSNSIRSPEILLTNKYIHHFYKGWQEYKQNRKLQTYNDMIRNVREAIVNPNNSLKSKLQAKYKIAIIDEFQDTNQLQYDIFNNIFNSDSNHQIIVVGDPKQSIYAFQGADVFVYQKAKKDIIGDNPDTLTTNYRSRVEMIDVCNVFFNEMFKDGSQTFINSSSPVNNNRKAILLGKDIEPMWVFKNNNESISINKYAEEIAKQIVEFCRKDDGVKTNLQIQNKDKFKDVTFSDIAILSRTRSEQPEIIAALKKAGIPYITYNDKGLFGTVESYQWISVLDAIATDDFVGSKRDKFKKALFTYFFNKSLQEINEEKYESDDTLEMKLILKWKIDAKNRAWEDLIDNIIEESNLYKNLASLNHIQSLSKFKQIGNYCIKYLTNHNSLIKLVKHLSDLANKEGELESDEGASVEKATDNNCVKIMTIHASKGLQFPVVISFAGYKNPAIDKVVTYHNETGKILSIENANEATEEKTAELKRLMYVAYTRAEQLLIVPYIDRKTPVSEFLNQTVDNLNGNKLIKIVDTNNNSVDYSILRHDVRKILNTIELESAIEDSAEDQEKIIKELIHNSYFKNTFKNSYSSLSHGNDDENNRGDEESDEIDKEGKMVEGLSKFDKTGISIKGDYDTNKQEIIPDDFPKGTKIGTALHEVFEVFNYRLSPTSSYQLICDSLSKQGIKDKFNKLPNEISKYDEWVEYIQKMLAHVLNAKMPIIEGGKGKENEFIQLKNIDFKDRRNEIEFNFSKDKQDILRNYFNGFVDLIFKYNNRYIILDWKSDSLDNDAFTSYFDESMLKKHVDEHYSIQRVLYAYCLIRWLKNYHQELDEETIFNNYFGGVYYVFLKGCYQDTSNGIYAHTWYKYNDLKEAFEKIIKEKVR